MTENSPTPVSPPWSRTTKAIVTVAGLIVLVLAFRQFSALVRQIVIAGIIAYLMTPVVAAVERHTPLERGHAIIVTYLTLLALVVWGVFAIGVAGVNQVNSLIDALPGLLEQTVNLFDSLSKQSWTILGFEFSFATFNLNLDSLGSEVAAFAESARTILFSRGQDFVGGAAQVAYSTLTALGNFLLIFMMSLYISADVPRLGYIVADWAQMPGYRKDAERLWRDFGRIWRAYLRGQFILAITMWIVVWFSLALAGVQNAFALGLLSGLLEFLPVIGPLVAGGVAVIVALFQPENWLGLPFWQYGLVVLAIMALLQQLENSILVPRIVGKALDLHPLLTLVVVFMGSSVAGILGAILAAPVAATVKLLGNYAWRKLFDQPPFPEDERDPEPSRGPRDYLHDLREWIVDFSRRGETKAAKSEPPPADPDC